MKQQDSKRGATDTSLRKIVLTVCYYYVTYTFQSETTLYSCLNVKELLTRNRRDIRVTPKGFEPITT